MISLLVMLPLLESPENKSNEKATTFQMLLFKVVTSRKFVIRARDISSETVVLSWGVLYETVVLAEMVLTEITVGF